MQNNNFFFSVSKLPCGLLIKGLCPLEKEEKDDEMGRGSDGRKEGGRRESPMLCSSGDQRPQETKGGRIREEGRREEDHILHLLTIVFFN